MSILLLVSHYCMKGGVEDMNKMREKVWNGMF